MSVSAYEKLTDSCLLIGVISALTFGPLGSLGWIAGLIGIMCGAMALVAYFLYHNSNQPRCVTEAKCEAKELTLVLPVGAEQESATRLPTELVSDMSWSADQR